MIRVSEMYRISGGCNPSHKCSECAEYIGSRNLSCLVYPKEYGAFWDGNRMSCKYYRNKEHGDQIDISDIFREKYDECRKKSNWIQKT